MDSTEEESLSDVEGQLDAIQVYVRIRPSEKNDDSGIEEKKSIQVQPDGRSIAAFVDGKAQVFAFDEVATEETRQEEVFRSVGKVITDNCIAGYNGTVFAYGQTGSGKTFTMLGPSDEDDNVTHAMRGVIPRTFEYLFSQIARETQKRGNKVSFLCKCSFLEIYNEVIYDLLDSTASTGLRLHEDMKKGVFVESLTEQEVSSPQDAYHVLRLGSQNRRVAATYANRESSRSHAVFTITIQSKEIKAGGVVNIRESRLNLVDLAGSERQRDTQAVGQRLKEASNINQSLSALGNVIKALVEQATQAKKKYIPYRNSRLTFLLRDSLGGNTKTYIIANVNPSARCLSETLSTLNFAHRAKMIKNKIVVNEDTQGNVAQLQEEIKRLKSQLGSGSSSAAQSGSPGESDATLQIAMELKRKAEADVGSVLSQMKLLQELSGRQERALLAAQMIIKLRHAYIDHIKQQRSSAIGFSERERLLLDEIHQLRLISDQKIADCKLAIENFEVREEIARIQEAHPNFSAENAELVRIRRYSLLLEDRVNELLKANRDANTVMERRKRQSLAFDAQALAKRDAEIESLHETIQKLEKQLSDMNAAVVDGRKAASATSEDSQEQLEHAAAVSAAMAEQIRAAQQELDTLRSQNEQLSRHLATLRNEKELAALDLEDERRATMQRESELSTQCAMYEQEMLRLKSEVAMYKGEVEQLQEKHESFQLDLSDAVEQTSFKEAQIVQCTATIEEMRREKTLLQALLETSEAKRELLLQSVTQLQAQLGNSCSSDDMRNLLSENSHLSTQVQEKQTELVSLAKENEQLQEKVDQLSAKINEQTNSLNSMLVSMKALKTQVQDSEAALKACKNELEDTGRLHDERVHELQVQIQLLETQQVEQACRLALESQRAAEAEKHALDAKLQLAKLESEKLAISDKHAMLLEKARRERDTLLHELGCVRTTFTAEVTGLSEQLQSKESLLQKHCLESQQAALTQSQRIDELMAELSRRDFAAADLEKRNAELKQANERMSCQLAEAGLESSQVVASLRKQIEARDASLLEMETRVSQLCQASTANQKLIDSLQLSVAALESKQRELAAEKDGAVSALTTAAQTSSKQLEALQARLDASEDVRASLKQNHDALVQNHTALAQDHTALVARYNFAVDKVAETEKRVRELEFNVLTLQDEVAQVSESRNVLQHELQRQTAVAEAALEDAEAMVDDLARIRESEAKVFAEKEALQSQLEITMEEKHMEIAKLSEELDAVRSENARLAGHQNSKQKIQLHLQIKKENNSLREMNAKLTNTIRALQVKYGDKENLVNVAM